ncbi:MAG: hypothetical protein L6V88_01065 [Anaerotruncus sp.]|nr:MAG: hypothetical protein L6V88_01065 [Anaerotruncus sp.]
MSFFWEQFKEDGFVITDESGHETDAVFKAVALQNIVGEFNYRMYDAVNETGLEDVIEYLQNIGVGESDIIEYCESEPEIEIDPADFEATVKNALDYVTELAANKLLEDYSADDVFLTTSSPPHMILSRISPMILRTRMNFLPLLIPIRRDLIPTKKNIPPL